MLQCLSFNRNIYRFICHERLRMIFLSYSTCCVLIIYKHKSCFSLNVFSLRIFISLYILRLSSSQRFSMNHNSGSFITREKSNYLNVLIFFYNALLISHDDHKDPEIKGYTMTGILRGIWLCFFVNRKI